MFNQNSLYYPYPSMRHSIYAKRGMVATSQPLAAQAGLEILKKGGNAIDAAIAAAACLTVVEPTSNGIGSDAFALVWTNGKLHGLNASGFSPKNLSIETLREQGYEKIPETGWASVTVPGAPAAWAQLSERFGNLPLTEVLKPAIEYAKNGYPVSYTLGRLWALEYERFKRILKGEEYQYWFDTFAPNGRAPYIGEVWASPDHAKTLEIIAQTNAEAFYRGEIAEKIAQFAKETNGYITADDLAEYQVEWVEPIKTNYRGYDVWEIPPNGQGLIALLALNIVEGFDFEAKDSIETYHRQIEALKLAFVDGQEYITDPRDMKVSVQELLAKEYAKERRKLIGEQALMPKPSRPPKGGTVYLATADDEGNMVSFIQSNYIEFGSGLVVPGTGISLQNRGHSFSLNPDAANCLKPRKKPYHTIIPGFLTKGKEAVGPFGVMGAFMQPQGHLQVIMNTIDFQLNPQAALDAPRWKWVEGRTIELEHSVPHHIAQGLADRGHDVRIAVEPYSFGRGQIIWRDPNTGVLVGGTEHRTDGMVAAW